MASDLCELDLDFFFPLGIIMLLSSTYYRLHWAQCIYARQLSMHSKAWRGQRCMTRQKELFACCEMPVKS